MGTLTPTGWAMGTLGDVCKLINGDRGKNYPSKDKLSTSGLPFVNAGHLDSGRIQDKGMNYIDEARYDLLNSGKFILGDILYCIRGSLGKLALNKDFEKGAIASSLIIIRTCSNIIPIYVFYYLKSPLALQMIKKFDNGTAQPNLSGADLAKFEFPFPPFNEQKRIVAKIEELFSELDNGIAALKTAREQLKVYRQAVLKHAFEGKLTEQWRKENADKLESPEQILARIQQERETRYQQQLEEWKAAVKAWEANGKEGKKPGKPKLTPYTQQLDLAALPSLPDKWSWVELSRVMENIQIGPFGSLLHKSDYVVDGIPLINPSHIKNQKIFPDWNLTVTEEKLSELAKYVMQNNDIVVGRRGEMGRCAVVTEKEIGWLCGTGSLFIRPLNIAHPVFYSWVIASQRVREFLSNSSIGTTMQNLNEKILKGVPVPVCTIDEQYEIVRQISSQYSLIDKLESDINDQMAKAETLRQSILKKAFSGQLVPQDPNDEPASELLARIQAEKAVSSTKAKKKVKR